MQPLAKNEIERFSRQLLLPEIGLEGQKKLKNARVLIVGAGGLGSPVALYLAAAGIGHLGVLDYDTVEISNLQRQIIHDEDRVGTLKSESAKLSIQRLYSGCDCEAFNVVLDSSNAMEIVAKYDIVVDATDNVATRYLLNDVCILLNKVLVSGSALRMDGQLTVYNYNGGPCYRCLFPTPPPAETVVNCSDGGVLGVVTGIIGCFQALEVIKIAAGIGASYSQKLMLFDATSSSIRNVKLRGKSPNCAVCGTNPSISEPIDYVQFCGASATDKAITQYILSPSERISCEKYKEIQMQQVQHLLLDIRPKNQFDIASLPNSVNIPWDVLPRRLGEVLDHLDASNGRSNESAEKYCTPVYVLCRRGNDSQLATRLLQASGIARVWDIEGGLESWADIVDPNFPKL